MIDFGRGWEGAVKLVGLIMLISIPLATWKAIELVVWLWKHVSVSFN